MTTMAVPPRTVEQYEAIFDAERRQVYPMVDALERRFGYAVDRDRLEAAARVLACPLKEHAPNWQHGRVIYAMTCAYLAQHGLASLLLLDIGTAKGFSALCLQWALKDSGRWGAVVSVDVLDPTGRDRRNSVLECTGPKTLAEYLEPWPDAGAIRCLRSTGIDWLERHPARVHVAFIDGKHAGAVVDKEGRLIAMSQEHGDLVMFDDVQIDGVALAVKGLRSVYELDYVDVTPHRRYALGRRK